MTQTTPTTEQITEVCNREGWHLASCQRAVAAEFNIPYWDAVELVNAIFDGEAEVTD